MSDGVTSRGCCSVAEDGAHQVLRHLQRGAAHGGGRAVGRLPAGGVLHAGEST